MYLNVFSTFGTCLKKCVNATTFWIICGETKKARRKVFGYLWSFTTKVWLCKSNFPTRIVYGTVQFDLWILDLSNFVSSGDTLIFFFTVNAITILFNTKLQDIIYMERNACHKMFRKGPNVNILTFLHVHRRRFLVVSVDTRVPETGLRRTAKQVYWKKYIPPWWDMNETLKIIQMIHHKKFRWYNVHFMCHLHFLWKHRLNPLLQNHM